jgi:hypothetical protein
MLLTCEQWFVKDSLVSFAECSSQFTERVERVQADDPAARQIRPRFFLLTVVPSSIHQRAFWRRALTAA